MDGLSLNFTWKRLVILMVLIFLYFLLGGFSPPDVSETGLYQGGMNRSWIYMIALFCTGAVSASLVDHEFGLFPPSNFRPLYIILGLVLMGSAVAWMYSVRSNTGKTTGSTQSPSFSQRQISVTISTRMERSPENLTINIGC